MVMSSSVLMMFSLIFRRSWRL